MIKATANIRAGNYTGQADHIYAANKKPAEAGFLMTFRHPVVCHPGAVCLP